MSIMVIAYTKDGASVKINEIFSMRYKMQMYNPNNKMEITLLKTELPADLAMLLVYLNNTALFSGYVEKYYDTESKGGVYTRIIARQYAARLSDIQIQKGELYQYTGDMITQKFAMPYGVSKHSLPSGSKPILYMDKDMSAWQIIDIFCRQLYGKIPRIDRAGAISVDVLSDRIFRVSNVINDNSLRFVSQEMIYDRSKMISKVFVQESGFGGNEPYSIELTNTRATNAGITRIKYLDPKLSWFPWPAQYGKEVIKDSVLDSVVWSACIAGLYDIYPGDIIIPDSYIYSGRLYAAEVKMFADEAGQYTYVKAYAYTNNYDTI